MFLPHPPATPPTLPYVQALNKHYRKKLVSKDFGMHGVFEGKLPQVGLEENGGATRKKHGRPGGGKKGMERKALTQKLPPRSKCLGRITDCWMTPSGREYAHIQYADGDEEDVSITKVRTREGKGRAVRRRSWLL